MLVEGGSRGRREMKALYLRIKLRYLMWRYRRIRDHIRFLEMDLAYLAREIQKVRGEMG